MNALLGIQQDAFDLLVGEWLAYRKSIKKPFKSKHPEIRIKKMLINMSNGDIMKAREIVDWSMANEYQGLFPPPNGSSRQTNNTSPKARRDAEFAEAFAAKHFGSKLSDTEEGAGDLQPY